MILATLEDGAKVIETVRDPADPGGTFRTEDVAVRLVSEPERPMCVGSLHLVTKWTRREPRPRKCSYGFEEPIAGVFPVRHSDERFVDEAREQTDHFGAIDAGTTTDRLERVESKRSGKLASELG